MTGNLGFGVAILFLYPFGISVSLIFIGRNFFLPVMMIGWIAYSEKCLRGITNLDLVCLMIDALISITNSLIPAQFSRLTMDLSHFLVPWVDCPHNVCLRIH